MANITLNKAPNKITKRAGLSPTIKNYSDKLGNQLSMHLQFFDLVYLKQRNT